MAFAVTQRASDNNVTTPSQTLTSSSFTPAANSRLFVFAVAENNAHVGTHVWGITNTGSLSFTLLDESTTYNWNTDPNYKLNVIGWYADVGGSPVSMTVTLDPNTGETATYYIGLIAFDVTGYDTGTPFAQASVDNGASKTGGDSETGTLTLGSAPTSGNLVVAMFGSGADLGGGFATPTGYTELTDQNTGACQGAVFYHTSTATAAVTCSDLGEDVGNWGGIIFEMTLLTGGAYAVNKSESITVTDTPTVSLPNALQVNVAESIATTDTPTVTLPGAAPEALNINVSETVYISERVRLLMDIVYVTGENTAITVATASPVVTKPTGATILGGDLILVFFSTETTTNTATPIAGFARAGSEVDAGTDATTSVYWKIASGTLGATSDEPATWTFTDVFNSTEVGSAYVIVYRNNHQTLPINTSNQTSTATATALSGPSVTPNFDRCMIVQLAGTDPGTGAYAGTPDTDPVGVERRDAKDAGNNAYIYIQEYLQATAAALALDVTGLTSDTYGHHQIAIAPVIGPYLEVHVTENITVTDTPALSVATVTLEINVSESIGVTDTPTLAVSSPQINVSESITVTDTPTVSVTSLPTLSINIVEYIYVIETPFSGSSILEIGVSESISVTDTPTLEVSAPQVNASDTITLTDIPTVDIQFAVNVSDTITVTDTPTVFVEAAGVININVSESITLADTPTLAVSSPQVNVSESITLADTPTLAVQEAGEINVNVSDNITVTDTPTLETSSPQVNISENISVTDTPTVVLVVVETLNVNASENIIITETPTFEVSISEINIAESISISDTTAIVLAGALLVDVIDNISLTDAPTIAIGVNIGVTEYIGLTESATVVVLEAGTLGSSVLENITVSEIVSLAMLPLSINISESIIMSELVILRSTFDRRLNPSIRGRIGIRGIRRN